MGLPTSFKMNSGYTIPALGLGTWQSKPNEVKNAVECALKAGYRHIDGATAYDNEKEVGDGWKASGVPREDIFLTSKLWNTHHKPEDVETLLDITLSELQTDYLDLYLIHWPVSFQRVDDRIRFPVNPVSEQIDVIDVPIADTWKAMEEMVKKGKVRTIGVSNFTQQKIEELWKTAEIKPAVNQIEAHPYLQQPGLLEFCQKNDVIVQAYSPLGNNVYGKPRADADPVVHEVAKELGKGPVQVLLSWGLQRGTVVLSKSVTPSRIIENMQVFELPQAAFEKINKMDVHGRYNFPSRLGVDIFGEVSPEELKKGVEDWKEAQRKLKAGQ